jgi:hypothetical protein
MKLSRLYSTLLTCVCFAGFAQADIVVLKDGKRLEGSITAENPQAIHMRYKLTPKIWDDKDIPRTEIAEIIKQKPEELELIELKKLFPIRDLMTAEKYEQLIQDRLRPFVNRYPGTKEAAEAEKLIEEALTEKEKVVAGGIKMEGKWLTPDEAKAAQLNIKAYGLRAAMLEKEAAKDYPAALKEFDQFNSREGLASVYYPKAVEEALAILTKFDAQVEQMIKDQPALQKMRDEGINKLIEPDRSRTKSAIGREWEQWKTTYDLERKTSKWFTPYKYDLASLKALSQAIATEKSRLAGINIAAITKTNEAIAMIMSSLPQASKNPEALKKMRDAILAGSDVVRNMDANSQQFYTPIFQAYWQMYTNTEQQIAAQSQPGTAAVAAPGAVGGSSAIAGTGATPGMDDRVAAALAAAAAGGTAAAPAPGAAVAMPAGTPAPGAVQAVPNPAAVAPATGMTAAPAAGVPVQPSMVAPGTVPPQAGYAPQVPQPQPGAYQQQPYNAAPMAVPPQAAPAPVEEGGGLSTNTLLLIGVGVVVIVLVAAMSGGKKKK